MCSSLDSVDAVTSDASALGGSSRVEIDSLDLRLRRDSFSTNGSGLPLSQASSLVPWPLLGGVAGAAGSGGGDIMFGGLVLGDDLRRRLRPGDVLRPSVADASPWLFGLRRLRLSRISSSRGDVIADIRLSSYSTVTTFSGS
jgi:hypothetical protein